MLIICCLLQWWSCLPACSWGYGQLTIPFLRGATLHPHLDPLFLLPSCKTFKLHVFCFARAFQDVLNACMTQRAGFHLRCLKCITLGFRATCFSNIRNQKVMAMWLLHSAELWFATDVYECMGTVRKFAVQSPSCMKGFEEKSRHQIHFRNCKSCFGVFRSPD